MKRTAVAAVLLFSIANAPAWGAGGYGMLNAGIAYFNQGRYADASCAWCISILGYRFSNRSRRGSR
jgi:hypothetical protein